MVENMNSGKTHKFLSWAAENATVPDYAWSLPSTTAPPGSSAAAMTTTTNTLPPALNPLASPIYKGEKRPDYVFKADDDSLIVLGELERRLRVAPRSLTFWGYLIKNTFMGGECYGMSFDLVKWIAGYEPLKKMIQGKEDKLVANWVKMHPQREEIVWISERCAIYDHPKAGTV